MRRGSEEFIGHGNNSQFHVFALNLPKNQLTQLTEDAIDELFCRLKEEFKIKPEDCPVFFLYDRDVLSYKKNELRIKYVKKYTDPYGTDDGNQGQLLLSYPAVESFLLSCIMTDTFKMSCKLGKNTKNILINELYPNGYREESDIHLKSVDMVFTEHPKEMENRLIHAVNEMENGLSEIGIQSYDLDDLGAALLEVYDFQQEKYNGTDTFSLISLIGMALLELGVIIECDSTI